MLRRSSKTQFNGLQWSVVLRGQLATCAYGQLRLNVPNLRSFLDQ